MPQGVENNFVPGIPVSVKGKFSEKYVVTHCILVILLDDIEMLLDNFKKKLAEKPKEGDGFRSIL